VAGRNFAPPFFGASSARWAERKSGHLDQGLGRCAAGAPGNARPPSEPGNFSLDTQGKLSGMSTTSLFDDSDARGVASGLVPADSRDRSAGSPRLRRPDRQQVRLEPCCLDDRLPPAHPVRTVWEVTGRLDLSAFYDAIEARGDTPGRSATDPRLLVSLWLYGAIKGIGNGRKLARLCAEHDAYRWLCGGVPVNYHTLNDFRVGHEKALDDLLTRLLATLMHHQLVTVNRISQDGTRVRASAGAGSFRRRSRLEQYLAEAQAQVEALKVQGDEEPGESARRRAAEGRAAAARVTRLEAALTEMSKLEASAAEQQKRKPAKKIEPRASMTDPQARRMRMPDGGFQPAYNVQIATDPTSRAIVGIEVTNHGTDHGEDEPLRRQVERRTGGKVAEHLLDGGFVTRASIERAAAAGVAIYAPLRQTRRDGTACTHHPKDSPGLRA
jgi:transposase